MSSSAVRHLSRTNTNIAYFPTHLANAEVQFDKSYYTAGTTPFLSCNMGLVNNDLSDIHVQVN